MILQSNVHFERNLSGLFLGCVKLLEGSSWQRSYGYGLRPRFGCSSCVSCVTVYSTKSLLGVLVINNYGPILYKTLGYSTVQQIIYPAAWLTFAVGLNAIAMLFVDRFPRPKYMAFGVFGCMVSLSCEAAIIASFIPSTNYTALRAGVAMLFVFQVFYSLCLDGTQFSYLGELFPTHLRAKGICLGVSIISLMNIIWLQSAPVAFENVGWKFYLALIIPGTIGCVIMWFVFPDTKGLPLEEVAAIFGDADEVAVYQREIEIDHNTHTIVDHHNEGGLHVGSVKGGNDLESSGEGSLAETSKAGVIHEEKQHGVV